MVVFSSNSVQRGSQLLLHWDVKYESIEGAKLTKARIKNYLTKLAETHQTLTCKLGSLKTKALYWAKNENFWIFERCNDILPKSSCMYQTMARIFNISLIHYLLLLLCPESACKHSIWAAWAFRNCSLEKECGSEVQWLVSFVQKMFKGKGFPGPISLHQNPVLYALRNWE